MKDEPLIDLAVSKDDLDTLLDALEAKIDFINEYGNPSDWEKGAKTYKLKQKYMQVYVSFDEIVRQQTEEDEG